jgi:hypothetical protein
MSKFLKITALLVTLCIVCPFIHDGISYFFASSGHETPTVVSTLKIKPMSAKSRPVISQKKTKDFKGDAFEISLVICYSYSPFRVLRIVAQQFIPSFYKYSFTSKATFS